MPLKDKNKAYTMLNHADIKPNNYFSENSPKKIIANSVSVTQWRHRYR